MFSNPTVRNHLRLLSFVFEKEADPTFLALQASNAAEVDRFDPIAHATTARIALARKGA